VICSVVVLHHGATAFVVPVPKTQSSVVLYDYMDKSYSNDVSTRTNTRPNEFPRPGYSAPLTRYNSRPRPEGGPMTRRNEEDSRSQQETRERNMPNPQGPYYERHSGPLSTVQGGSRGTWSSSSYSSEQAEVFMETEGRPLDAEFEMWQGPNNTPQRVRVYSEDGRRHPFRALVEAPRGGHSMSVRNTGPLEFPLAAGVEGGRFQSQSYNRMASAFSNSMTGGQTVQGGSLKTFPFYDYNIEGVKVSLWTEGLPLMAVIELWQGPGSVKQLAEIYSDDGSAKPFHTIVETRGYGSTIAIRNVGPLEYPLIAKAEPV